MVLAEVDQSGGKTSPVGNAGEEKLGGLVQLVLEALLSNLQDVCDVGHSKEVLHVMKTVGLGISIRQLRIDLRFTERFASHLEEANQVIVLAGAV